MKEKKSRWFVFPLPLVTWQDKKFDDGMNFSAHGSWHRGGREERQQRLGVLD